jgi:hypothetical protein
MTGPLARLANAATSNKRFASAMRRVVPERARVRVGSAIGVDKPRPLELARLELIRQRDAGWLTDPERLEHELLPALGLCDDIPGAFPTELEWAVGGGLRHWQAPNQFGPYLAHLARYPIRTYLEVGVRHGGTFAITVEYLSRFRALDEATGIDIDDVPAMHALRRERPEVRFLRLDTGSPEFAREVDARGPYDLVLVDADHSYEACRRDVDTVLDHANVLALHDVVDAACPGVRQVWRELRAELRGERDFFEFTAQYDEILRRNGEPAFGLGIAVRPGFGPRPS